MSTSKRPITFQARERAKVCVTQLVAEPAHVDAMLSALGDSDRVVVVRHTLSSGQASALIASIAAGPPASRGPTETGDAASSA
jgi:hypothetical protein